jgi:hypothetical protein
VSWALLFKFGVLLLVFRAGAQPGAEAQATSLESCLDDVAGLHACVSRMPHTTDDLVTCAAMCGGLRQLEHAASFYSLLGGWVGGPEMCCPAKGLKMSSDQSR